MLEFCRGILLPVAFDQNVEPGLVVLVVAGNVDLDWEDPCPLGRFWRRSKMLLLPSQRGPYGPVLHFLPARFEQNR